MESEQKEKYFINSLAKGLQVLSAFTIAEPNLTISEIAAKTGMSHSTVFRLVYTLEHLGYLVRNKDSKKYTQSARVLTLGLLTRTPLSVRDVALPYMEELGQLHNDLVKMAILDRKEIVYIAVIDDQSQLKDRSDLGYRIPAFYTALGRVLIAFQPIENWHEIVSSIDFLPKTDKTITDPDVFIDELIRIRARGYAILDQEYTIDRAAIAAPIFNYSGMVEAALSMSLQSSALHQGSTMDTCVGWLLDYARKISESLGYHRNMFKEKKPAPGWRNPNDRRERGAVTDRPGDWLPALSNYRWDSSHCRR